MKKLLKNFVSVRDTDESIQGTYKSTKKCASTRVFFYIKRIRVRSYIGVRARETPIIAKINNINY